MNPPNLPCAAADLYRAAVDWLEWLDSDGDGIDGAEHEQRLLEAMRAAVAKADDPRLVA